MRVLFLSQVVPYPPHGGVLQRGYNLLRELGAHANVRLLAFVHPNLLPSERARQESRHALLEFCEGVEYFPLWPKRSPVHAAAALAVSAASSRPFSVIAHSSAAFEQSVAEALRGEAFDLVHADTLALSQFLDRRVAVPSVVTHHNVESMLMERRAEVEPRLLPKLFLRREGEKLRAFEAAETRRFDVNIVVSSDDERALAARIPGVRTAVVPNGVDTKYFSPDVAEEAPALVYVGGMGMFANRDAVTYFLNDIWPLIRVRIPAVKFYAVGRAPAPEVRALAERDPRIVVTGFVEDVRPIVRQSAVYVVPLRVGGGTRLKVLDAMAMGKALVSTAIGCEGLDVQSGEHLMVADTPYAFAQATVALLRNPARRTALGRAARELVERRYSWSVVGRRLLDAYDDAMASRRRAS